MTLPDSSFVVLRKTTPYQYIGPFDTQEEAETYIADKNLMMSYVIEVRKP